MIEDSVLEGKKVSRPELIIGDEKFVWVLMNWWDSKNNGQPVLNTHYVASCEKARSLGLPITSIVMINLSNNWYADYGTPANDHQLKWIKDNLSVYSNSVCVAFANASGTETPQNVGDKLRFFLKEIGDMTGLPVIAWVSDTNMDLYPGEEFKRGLENQILAMWYDKPENVASAKPPAPTDYNAKNYFYVYDNRVLSRVGSVLTASLLGVSQLGASTVPPEEPGEEPGDPGDPNIPPVVYDGQTKRIADALVWLASKFGYTE